MKNKTKWEPTRFILNESGTLVANEKYVSVRSLLAINKAGALYQRYLNEYANGKMLDLGCGTAPLYLIYKDLVSETICIDWAKSFHENIHLDYIADLNKRIPIENETVDTVLLSDVMEHIYEYRNLVSETARVLKKGGKVILGVPFLYWLHEEPYDFHRYTRHQLIKVCNDHNLSILQIDEWGGPLSVIFDIIGKNLSHRLFPNRFQKLFVWLINTHIGKKIDNRRKQKFPLGYCLVAQRN